MHALHSLLTTARRNPAKALVGLVGVATFVLGIWARIYQLDSIKAKIFDEVYFPVFAQNYLTGTSFFDVHPPLGKFIIAVGEWIFGNTEFGWRIMPALVGILLPLLGGYLWWSWQKDRLGALFITAFLAIDTMLVAYSRVGLMDGVQVFFILATVTAAVRVKHPHQTIWPAIWLGLACSIKWISLGVFAPVAYILWRKKLLAPFMLYIPLAVAIYLLTVFLGQYWIHTPDPWQGVIEWHNQAMNYQLKLTATHPWSSEWWSWPLMLRPVLMYYESDPQGKLLVISAIGNPVLWWAGSVAVIASVLELIRVLIYERKQFVDHPLVPLVIGWGAFFIPWIPVHRVLFIYHYLPAFAFASLMLVWWLVYLWKWIPWWIAVLFLVIIGVGIYYLPMAMALPMTQEVLNQHLWIKSWL